MSLRAPNVLVRDKQTGHKYFVSEARYKSSPELWERLDSSKPKTTVAEAAAKKQQPASSRPADTNQEES